MTTSAQMPAAAQISVTEYLRSTFEPDAEYVNGQIEERHLGEYDHNAVQMAILLWFHNHDKQWRTRSVQEQRTRLRSGNFRLPDVSVFPRELPVEQVYTRPQLIAIEVLSSEDRHAKVQEKIDDYLDFGVAHIWIIDPKGRIGWDCSTGNWIRKDRFEVEASPIYLALDELFHQVDENEQ
jgi:Uma2 family endonuclease